MTLPASGTLTMSAIRTELGAAGSLNIGAANMRTLSGVASGAERMSDFYSKTAVLNSGTMIKFYSATNLTNTRTFLLSNGSLLIIGQAGGMLIDSTNAIVWQKSGWYNMGVQDDVYIDATETYAYFGNQDAGTGSVVKLTIATGAIASVSGSTIAAGSAYGIPVSTYIWCSMSSYDGTTSPYYHNHTMVRWSGTTLTYVFYRRASATEYSAAMRSCVDYNATLNKAYTVAAYDAASPYALDYYIWNLAAASPSAAFTIAKTISTTEGKLKTYACKVTSDGAYMYLMAGGPATSGDLNIKAVLVIKIDLNTHSILWSKRLTATATLSASSSGICILDDGNLALTFAQSTASVYCMKMDSSTGAEIWTSSFGSATSYTPGYIHTKSGGMAFSFYQSNNIFTLKQSTQGQPLGTYGTIGTWTSITGNGTVAVSNITLTLSALTPYAATYTYANATRTISTATLVSSGYTVA